METKEKLLRVIEILKTTDKDSPINAVQMAERLERDYGLGNVNRKSVYRDFDLLEACGYKLQDARHRADGKYLEHDFQDAELKILMDAVAQARCITEEDSRKLIRKLLTLTSNRGRSRFSHLITPTDEQKSVDNQAKDYIELMLEAVYQGKQIRFQYTEFDSDMHRVLRKGGRIYELNMYCLYWSNNNYYLIGVDDKHKSICNYRLDRVQNLQISDKPLVEARTYLGDNADLKIQEYVSASVNHFGGEKIRLVLECVPEQAQLNILHDFAGDHMYIEHLKNGRLRVTMEKCRSVTLIGWLMQYADLFQVIAPEDIRKTVLSHLSAALEAYQ